MGIVDLYFRQFILENHENGLSIEEIAAQVPYSILTVASIIDSSRQGYGYVWE